MQGWADVTMTVGTDGKQVDGTPRRITSTRVDLGPDEARMLHSWLSAQGAALPPTARALKELLASLLEG